MGTNSQGTNIAVKTAINPAILRQLPTTTNPLILAGIGPTDISRRTDSQNRAINIKETFEASFASIDKQLDDHINKLKYISSNPAATLTPSLETVKINDEFERYVKKSRQLAKTLGPELENLAHALKQQKDNLPTSDYLALSGEAQLLLRKKKTLDSQLAKIENGTFYETIN